VASGYILCRKGKKKSTKQRRMSVEICVVCKKAEKCDSYQEYLKAKVEDEPVAETQKSNGIEIYSPGGTVYYA